MAAVRGVAAPEQRPLERGRAGPRPRAGSVLLVGEACGPWAEAPIHSLHQGASGNPHRPVSLQTSLVGSGQSGNDAGKMFKLGLIK